MTRHTRMFLPKVHEKTPERDERMKFLTGEKKNREISGTQGFGVPSHTGFGPPPLRAPTRNGDPWPAS